MDTQSFIHLVEVEVEVENFKRFNSIEFLDFINVNNNFCGLHILENRAKIYLI